MKDNQCRIIKIEKDALYEFIYENFIANHKELMDEDAIENINTFTIDWETGTFLFCAHKSENENGESEADFFNVVAWRGLGENIHKYCKKGSKVFIAGEIHLN